MFASIISEPPIVVVTNRRPAEKDIYKEMWSKPEYRQIAPGEHVVFDFLEQAKPKSGESILDLGCGTGRGSLALAAFGNLDVTMVDFADNCLDDDIRPMLETQKHVMRFVEADLTESVPVSATYGYCTDVLEHIHPDYIDKVLDNCLQACKHVFFQISTVDDLMGEMIGHPLHLTVQPYSWWLKKFTDRNCVIHWSREDSNACLFYVSAWIPVEEIEMEGRLNTDLEIIRANVRQNVSLGIQQAQPYPTNDIEVMLVGGAPSLAKDIETIKALRSQGVKLVCLNNAYQFCLDHGLKPSAMVIVDARPFNARFVENVIPDCKYFIASQCDSSVFAKLPKEQTYIWHTSAEEIRDILLESYNKCYPVPGGSTVLLRAIPLFRMLGFKRFHVFGCDSCLEDGAHHAYSQPENDEQPVIPVRVGDKEFMCHPWMISQAREFIDLVKCMGDVMELEIYGGLLRQILVTGADRAALEEF